MGVAFPFVRRLAVAACLAFLPGCLLVAGAAAGAAGAVYVAGDLEATLEATPPEVAEAVEEALEELSLPVLESSATALDGRVLSRTAKDKEVEILLEARGDAGTHLSIRIGAFGDEEQSQRILDAIQKHL